MLGTVSIRARAAVIKAKVPARVLQNRVNHRRPYLFRFDHPSPSIDGSASLLDFGLLGSHRTVSLLYFAEYEVAKTAVLFVVVVALD